MPKGSGSRPPIAGGRKSFNRRMDEQGNAVMYGLQRLALIEKAIGASWILRKLFGLPKPQ